MPPGRPGAVKRRMSGEGTDAMGNGPEATLRHGGAVARIQRRALGRVESDDLDPWQLAHASIKGCGEVATLSSMLGDDQTVGESAAG